MLIAFWLLLFLYVGLALLYAATSTKQIEIKPWPILTDAPKKEPVQSLCKFQTDCPSTHICLGNKCIPKLLSNGECDPVTGQWISYIYRGATFAICICLKPNLINQKYFGGNCDVDVGCGIHGRYLPDKNACICDAGYKPVGLSCQKIPAIDYLNLNPCSNDEIEVSNIKPSDGFHADYIEKLSHVKCVKRPCSFDALSGKPLKRAKYKDEWGCVCDPRYGLFGVDLEGTDKKYLKTPGFDACASIYSEEPSEPNDVKLITYFYLGKKDPVSIIFFDKLDSDNLITPLKGKDTLAISQKRWQYDYAQYFFDTHPLFRARTRSLSSFYLFNIETAYEWKYENEFSPAKCHEIPNFWNDRLNGKSDAYDLLYKSPVCRVASNDPQANPKFWDKVVVNPQHITFKDYAYLAHFNAFELYYDSSVGLGRWTLDLDHEYKIDTYRNIETDTPNYNVFVKDRPSIPQLMIEGQM